VNFVVLCICSKYLSRGLKEKCRLLCRLLKMCPLGNCKPRRRGRGLGPSFQAFSLLLEGCSTFLRSGLLVRSLARLSFVRWRGAHRRILLWIATNLCRTFLGFKLVFLKRKIFIKLTTEIE